MDLPEPHVFISYSWTSPAHEAWVMRLATLLVENGVNTEIDKWSLLEGQDKYKFMERMVSDPAITHVIVISDARYAQRADERTGGVGTESQTGVSGIAVPCSRNPRPVRSLDRGEA